MEKWLGSLEADKAAIVNIRPDGYVGSVSKWDVSGLDAAQMAAAWLESYYGSFLAA